MIPVLLAGGLFRAVNSIFGPDLLGLYTLESNLYILFDFLYDAAFYFMPILVGYNAAKQLGVNGMLGSFIGSILMVPDFAVFATNGQPFTVFGIPATVTNYAQTVLPIMLSVPLFCLVYKIVKKFMPDLLTTVFTPFLSLLISMPFILCLLAPLGTIVGNAISGGLAWFGMTTGWFGVAVIAALWEFLVMSGMHLALMMPMMADFFETGIGSGPMNIKQLCHLGLLRCGSGRSAPPEKQGRSQHILCSLRFRHSGRRHRAHSVWHLLPLYPLLCNDGRWRLCGRRHRQAYSTSRDMQ